MTNGSNNSVDKMRLPKRFTFKCRRPRKEAGDIGCLIEGELK